MNRDNIKGAFFGLMLGDALGAPHEFKYMKKNYSGRLEHQATLRSQFQPPRTLALGQITDDSEMAITLLRSMAAHRGEYSARCAAQRYMAWCNSTSLNGKNTRDLFKGIKTLKGYETRFAKKFGMPAFQTNNMGKTDVAEQAQSNGSLMRSMPLALAIDYKQAVEQDVYLTNPSLAVVQCEQVYVECIRRAFCGQSAAEVWAYASGEDVGIMGDILRDVRDGVRDVKENKSWMSHGMFCAMWCLYVAATSPTATYASLIDNVIRRGGDTDTNAAIAGALIGALVGLEKMRAEATAFEPEARRSAPEKRPAPAGRAEAVTGDNLRILETYLAAPAVGTDIPRPAEYALTEVELDAMLDEWCV